MSEDPKPWFPLRTARLVLREFRPGDFDDVHAYASQPEVARYMDWGPNTPAETQSFLDRMFEAQGRWPRDDVNLAIEHAKDRRLIGVIRLGANTPSDQSADLGYSINRDYWGRGVTTEAARALLSIAFGRLGMHRVWAWCDIRNAASYRVMEKLGMRREGAFREERRVKGAWRDTYVYAILDREFVGAQD